MEHALKPAQEPISVARKPISEKSVVDNCLKNGTGGLNIDGCRVEFENDKKTNPLYRYKNKQTEFGNTRNTDGGQEDRG